MKKSRGNKGQFSIIAALIVSIILVTAVIITYSMIRHNPSQESPKVLTSIGEMNLAVRRILEFTVGYYGSILQVTGNWTYAQQLASSYLQSGLVNIADSHPDWNPSFKVNFQQISTRWFTPVSYSIGNISVTYSMSGLGIEGVNYTTSSLLKVTSLKPVNSGEARFNVTLEGNEPELRLSKENFFFYKYSYSNSTWILVHPDSDPVAFSNGTYVLQIPSGVDQNAYSIKVADPRAIMVTAFYSGDSLASGIPQYSYTFRWNQTLYSSLTRDTLVVEALQNGTLRWLGQNLFNGKPIPPIPVKALHVNETVGGVNREVPFQVEDWGSNYRVPLGLTSNASVLSSRNMLVFLVNHKVQKVTFWWDGRDTAKQTSYAWTNRYFTGDNPSQRKLTNGILTITISSDYSTITSSLTGGSITSTASFMRINSRTPTYGSGPAYVIYGGIVRDIIQQEAEWSGGIANCPNVYSQIFFTLPANATYYTYALRLTFVNSSQSRTITDLSAIQLSVSGGSQYTENGTSGGYPISSNVAGLFYNFTSLSFQTGWAHHWSEFISSGSSGAGIMFTDDSNRKLYTFDNVAGQKTGALNVISSSRTIELNPVARSQYPASFTYPLDVTWRGAVVTFNNDQNNTIYPTSGNIGLWVMVENPPKISLPTGNNVSITVTSSPSGSGYVKVDGNATTTPATFIWTIGSNHTLQALSPVGPAGTRYVWTGWSDGGAQNHTYIVPASDATVTANWQTQYQVTFDYQVSGGGSGYSAPSVTYYQSGSPLSVTAGPSATVWVDSGSTYTYTTPLSGSTSNERWQTNQASGTVSSQGTIKPTYYHQYLMTLSYSVSGGGSGYSAPTFTANQFGSSYGHVLTTTATGYWFDSGSSWSETNPLSGSGSSQRWQTSQSTSGTISASATIAFTYYHQYSFTLSYSVSGGGSGYSAPTLTATQFGSSYTPTLSTTGTQYWLDAGQSWSVTNPLSGSGSSERWQTSQTVSGTVGSSSPTTAGGSLTFTYYHQYKMTLSYSVSGGGSGYSAPTFTANQFGVSTPQTLTTTATGYWFDAGASWSVTNPLTGSGSGERWQTSQSTSGTVSATTIAFIYYHQYRLTMATNFGTTTPAAGSTWYNASATVTISATAPSSGAGEQYLWNGWTGSGTGSYTGTNNPATVTMNGPITETASWRHQYQVTFDASSNVKGDSSATIVTVAGTGKTGAQLPYTNWYDSGSSLSYSYASPIASSSSPATTRYLWSSTSGLGQTLRSNTFTVGGTGTVTATYTKQTFGIDTNCIGFGSESSSYSSPITTTSMTAQANELIMVVITAGSSGSSSTRSFTVTDSFGTTYTLRGSTSSGSNAEQIAEYYAFTGSHTGSFTVTVTPSSYNRNFDVLAFGTTGAAASPFDTHAGLPYSAHNTGSSVPTVTGVSTSNANDMVLAFEGHLSSTAETVGTLAGTAFSAPSGFLNNANGEGCNAEYQIVSSTLSSATATFGTSVSNWVMIVDAVQRAW